MLWDQRIQHTYYLEHGADHVGSSLGFRTKRANQWLFKTMREVSGDFFPGGPDLEKAARSRELDAEEFYLTAPGIWG